MANISLNAPRCVIIAAIPSRDFGPQGERLAEAPPVGHKVFSLRCSDVSTPPPQTRVIWERAPGREAAGVSRKRRGPKRLRRRAT